MKIGFPKVHRIDRQKKKKAPIGVRRLSAYDHSTLASKEVVTDGVCSGIEYKDYADDFRSED